jgi:peptidoglycan/xylan/chitin deacetylase (PgdA/CDA1 family)
LSPLLLKTIRKSIKHLLQAFLPKRVVLWHGTRKAGRNIAITFDDGPNLLYTGKFIDILQKFGVRATFFLPGREIEQHPKLARRLVEYGHSIGNHTYSHRDLSKISMRELTEELQTTQSIIQQVTGARSVLFRPPWGRLGLNEIIYCLKNRLSVVLWSVDSMDHARSGIQSILSVVNAGTIEPGDIILFHDDNDYTLSALPIVIESLRKKYNFVTIEQMLKGTRSVAEK